MARLRARGLEAEGTRHDAILKLTHFFGRVSGMDAASTMAALDGWLRGLPHRSATLSRYGEAHFVRDSLREARQYYRSLARLPRRRFAGRPQRLSARALTAADDSLLTSILPAECLAAGRAIMAYFATFADEKGRVPGPVALSTTMLLELCGEARISVDGYGRSRVYVVVMRRLLELGLVTIHVDYSNGRHGRSYCVWYAFGSGQAPAPGEDGRILLGQRAVREGDLEALLEGKRARVVLRPRHVGCPTGAWWVRMFTRRAFTPGEFFGAEERHVLLGPFRDRRQPDDLPRVGPGDTPSSPPPRPPRGDPAHGPGDTAAPQHRSTTPAPASAPANDNALVSPAVSPAAAADAAVPRAQRSNPPSARLGAEIAEAVALAWTAFEHFAERGRPPMRVGSRRKVLGQSTTPTENAPLPRASALHAVLADVEAACMGCI